MGIARIKKNDTVIVTHGNDAGRTGTVKSVNPKKGTAIVEGLNKHKKGTAIVEGLNKHKKAMRRTQQSAGGLIDIELPIRLCKLMPYDADAKKGSRVSAAEKDGKKARKLKASGKVI